MKRFFALVTALFLCATSSANAAYYIANDKGGSVKEYVSRYKKIRASGQQVVIGGLCLSSCTLVLGILPSSRICITPQANLGFHAAWKLGMDSVIFGPVHMVEDPKVTAMIWRLYPRGVQQWLNEHGGMPPPEAMVYLKGQELAKFVPTCQ